MGKMRTALIERIDNDVANAKKEIEAINEKKQ